MAIRTKMTELALPLNWIKTTSTSSGYPDDESQYNTASCACHPASPMLRPSPVFATLADLDRNG